MAKVDRGAGYCPHPGMTYFKCEVCGNETFVSYPQSVSLGSDRWTYEYHCAKCGQMHGLTILNKR